MEFKQLAESIDGIREVALFEAAKSKGDAYGEALNFFKTNTLPDGSKWGSSLTPMLGFDNDPKRTKEKKKDIKDGIQYTARLRLAPGNGGGGGIGVSAAATNHYFNIAGTDPKTLAGMKKGFAAYTRKFKRQLNDALAQWIKKPNLFLHHIVGWDDRDKYTAQDVTFKGIRYEEPMIDPNRRLWPAGRTEIWQPMTADVVVTLKRKDK